MNSHEACHCSYCHLTDFLFLYILELTDLIISVFIYAPTFPLHKEILTLVCFLVYYFIFNLSLSKENYEPKLQTSSGQ